MINMDKTHADLGSSKCYNTNNVSLVHMTAWLLKQIEGHHVPFQPSISPGQRLSDNMASLKACGSLDPDKQDFLLGFFSMLVHIS